MCVCTTQHVAAVLIRFPSPHCRPLRPKFIHSRTTSKPPTADSQLANKENEHRAATAAKTADEKTMVSVPSPIHEAQEKELV